MAPTWRLGVAIPGQFPEDLAPIKRPITTNTMTFLELPNEMKEAIFHQCDLSTLKQVRLASRHISANAARSFHTHFEHPKFILHPHSLQTLVKIAKHEIYNKHVKRIEFNVLGFEEPKTERAGLSLEQRVNQRKWMAQSDSTVNSGQAAILLNSVFHNLPENGVNITFSTRHCGWGYDDLKAVLDIRRPRKSLNFAPTTELTTAFSLVVGAMTASSFKPDAIDLAYEAGDHFLNRDALGPTFLDPESCENTLSSLTKLALILGKRTHYAHTHVQYTSSFLRHTSMLKNLVLGFDPQPSLNLELSNVLRNNTLPHLQRLGLSQANLSIDLFISFLGRHSKTLQRLDLKVMSMRIKSEWQRLLAHLRHNMKLQRLVILIPQVGKKCGKFRLDWNVSKKTGPSPLLMPWDTPLAQGQTRIEGPIWWFKDVGHALQGSGLDFVPI
jgi:hypothetical protein